jgi:Tol biopolymer transport system component
MKLKRIASLLFPVASLVSRRRHLVFPCAVVAAALSVGFAGIATAEQCLVSTIAFTSTRDDPTGTPQLAAEIYLIKMNEDGTVDATVEPVRVTNNNTDGDAFSALSPDGKRIVFESNRNRSPGDPLNIVDLFLMKNDGSEQVFLTRGGSSASWSPDGKYITFHRSASGEVSPIKPDPGAATFDSDIFVAKVGDLLENVEPTNITFEDPRVFINDDPDWSPDGQKIVFTRHSVNDNHLNSITAEICVFDLGTPDAQPECFLGQPANSEEERAPAWSPDGTRIAYSCRIDGNDFEICVMNADGTGDLQLTNNMVGDLTPSWSPDGQKIVFHRPVAGRLQLFLMNADGTDQTQLTNTPGINLFAKWGVVRANCAEGE